jgi:protein transport protein SEC20
MSFEALQERLTALQDTHAQLRELIGRLSTLRFEPGSVPLGVDAEGSVAGELSAEIGQVLREEEEELDLLREEAEDLKSGRPGSDTEHHKARIRDGVDRLATELKGYGDSGVNLVTMYDG